MSERIDAPSKAAIARAADRLRAGALVAFLVGRGLMTRGSIPLPVLIGVPLLLLAVSALSCWVPARRAARIEALAALRWE